MRTKIFYIVFLCTQQLFAQDIPYKFGQISQKEIDMETYEKDLEADAVVLFDIGESFFFLIQITATILGLQELND